MLTGDQNIVDLGYSVRWDIEQPAGFPFQIAKPEETVRATAESAMRAVRGDATLDQAIGAGRTTIEARVQQIDAADPRRLSARASASRACRSAAPPPANAGRRRFKDVTAAQQEAVAQPQQRALLRAAGHRARAGRGRRSSTSVYEQYKLAPEVTRRRMYYETMEAVLAKTDKTIVEPPGVASRTWACQRQAGRRAGRARRSRRPHAQGAGDDPLWRNPIALGFAALAALILAASTFAIVPETQQAVILRFEHPVGTVNPGSPGRPFGRTGAGLIARRCRSSTSSSGSTSACSTSISTITPVLSTDQLRLNVDAFARFRIVDPLKAVTSTGSTVEHRGARGRTAAPAARHRRCATNSARCRSPRCSAPSAAQVMDAIQTSLQRTRAAQYGAQIVDVRIKHADLPDGSPLESALTSGCGPRASSRRTPSAPRASATRRSSAPTPMPTPRASTPRRSARTPTSTISTARCSRTGVTFGGDGRTPQGSTNLSWRPTTRISAVQERRAMILPAAFVHA